MPEWVQGLDVSFSAVTPSWCQARLAEGYRIFVQCLWTGGYANNARLRQIAALNLRVAREAGFITAGYVNTGPWFAPDIAIGEAKLNAGAEWANLGVVFNDVEIPSVKPQMVRDLTAALRAEGKKVALYSADWFAGLAGLPNFGEPYWFARYDGDPDVGHGAPAHPLGPVMGKQYGGATIEGVTVDFNTFNLDFFESEEEPDMTYDSKIVEASKALVHGEFVRATSAGDDVVYEVWRRGDVPYLDRVDDSKAALITAPIKDVPLGVVMAYRSERQIT